MNWLQSGYEVLGAPYPRLSIAMAALIGAIVFGGGWWLVGREHAKATQRNSVDQSALPARPTRVSIQASVNGASTDQDITVPAGTMVTLTARADAPLREIYGLSIAASTPYPYSVIHQCNDGIECSISVAKAGEAFTYSGYLSNIGGKVLGKSERAITVTWLR